MMSCPDTHECTVCGELLPSWDEAKIIRHLDDHGKFWRCIICGTRIPNDAEADRNKVKHQAFHIETNIRNSVIIHCDFSLVGEYE